MSFFKWLVVFIFAFLIAWVLIFTFTQEPFRQPAPARILAYQTPAIPIYVYEAGAFAAGLLIGMAAALYNYLVLSSQIRQKTRKINNLEQDLSITRDDLQRLREYSETDHHSPETSLEDHPEGEENL